MKIKRRWVTHSQGGSVWGWSACGTDYLPFLPNCSVLCWKGFTLKCCPFSLYVLHSYKWKSISLFLIQSCVHFICDSSFQEPKSYVKLSRGLLELLSCHQHFTLLTKTQGRDFDNMWILSDKCGCIKTNTSSRCCEPKQQSYCWLPEFTSSRKHTETDFFLQSKHFVVPWMSTRRGYRTTLTALESACPKTTGTRLDIQDLSEKFLLVWTITRD